MKALMSDESRDELACCLMPTLTNGKGIICAVPCQKDLAHFVKI
jgi:hypothetical protein